MDPNAALAGLRELAKAWLEGDATSDEAYHTLMTLLDQWEALDGWLTKGGFLPADWAAGMRLVVNDDKDLLRRALPMLIRLGDFIGNGDVDPSRPGGSIGARCDLIHDIRAKLAEADARLVGGSLDRSLDDMPGVTLGLAEADAAEDEERIPTPESAALLTEFVERRRSRAIPEPSPDLPRRREGTLQVDMTQKILGRLKQRIEVAGFEHVQNERRLNVGTIRVMSGLEVMLRLDYEFFDDYGNVTFSGPLMEQQAGRLDVVQVYGLNPPPSPTPADLAGPRWQARLKYDDVRSLERPMVLAADLLPAPAAKEATTPGLLTLADLHALGEIRDAAIHCYRVARLMPGSDDVIEGVARSIGDERGNFLRRDLDVRDGYLRVSGLFEYFWPIRELMPQIHDATFVLRRGE